MIELQNPYGNLASYRAYLSVDWGHSMNCFHLHQPDSAKLERLDVQADPCSMRSFVGLLRERFPSGKILILSEQKKGPLVNLLLDFDFIDLFAINPRAASAFRKSLHPSGAKNDPIDSSALLRMLHTHRDRMYPLSRDHDHDRRLDQLSRHRRSLVGEQLRVASRLEELLKNYYPQALPMLGPDTWSPISLAFLRKWPTYSQLMKSRDVTLRKFFTTHKSRSKAAIDKRIEARSQSAPLSTDPLLEELGTVQALDYVEQLALLNRQIRAVEKQIKRSFKHHPDCELFSGLPGAGEALAPRLAAAFGSDRKRFETPQQLQVYSGIAPIEVKSGNMRYTFMRQRCPKFIRQSFHEWAGLSIQNSKWAYAFYQLKLDRGMRKGKAKRALAFKWIRILHCCWIKHELYDETKYIQALIKRQSPVVAKMKELGLIDEQNNLLFS